MVNNLTSNYLTLRYSNSITKQFGGHYETEWITPRHGGDGYSAGELPLLY
jgi:hypothetical protein